MPVVAVHSLAALELAVVSAVVGIVVVALEVDRKLVVRHIQALEPVVVVLDNRPEQVAHRIADLAFHIHQEPEPLLAASFPASL